MSPHPVLTVGVQETIVRLWAVRHGVLYLDSLARNEGGTCRGC
ncbi:hypothetical protein [Streptomyces thioluteus]